MITKKEKRKGRQYKATDSVYKKAKAACLNGIPLATRIEKFVKRLAESKNNYGSARGFTE